MTERADIEPAGGLRRLSYTRRCGWVDWGHARPTAALGLKQQIMSEQGADAALRGVSLTLENSPAYVLTFGERMGKVWRGRFYGVSTDHLWVVARGLSRAVREQAALGIFLAASYEFEQLQSSAPFSWRTNSGFSAEDLTSDLIGFYIAFRGFSMARMRAICGEVSVKESYRIWDTYTPHGIGQLKNHHAKPILFPTKEGVSSPADVSFPHELMTIRPAPEGSCWVKPERGQLDPRLVAMHAKMNVSRTGRVGAAAPGTMAFPVRDRAVPSR